MIAGIDGIKTAFVLGSVGESVSIRVRILNIRAELLLIRIGELIEIAVTAV